METEEREDESQKLTTNIEMEAVDETSGHTCLVCGRSCPLLRSLSQHMRPAHSRSQTPQEDIDASEPHVDKRHFMESLNLMPAGPRETSEDKSLGRQIPELDPICSYQAWQLDTRGRLVEATEKCLGWEERLADAELAYDTEKGEYVPRKQGKGKKRKRIDTYSSNVKKIKGETGLDHSSNSLAHTKGADKRISEKDRISLNGLGHAFYEPLQNEKVKDVHLTPRHNNSRSQTPQEDIDASEPHVDKRHFMESLNLMPAGPRETSEDKSLGRRIPELDPICSYQAWQLDTRGRLVEATEKCLGWEERLADAELAYDTEKGEYVPRKQGKGKKRKRIDTYSSNVKKIKGETGLDHSSNSLAHTKGADKRISEKDRISLNGLGHAFYEPLQNEKVKDVHLTPRHNNSRSQTPQEDIDASEPHVDKRHFMESLNLMPAGPRETSEDKSLGRRIPELDPICSYQAWQLDTRGRLVEATEKCLGWEERLADAELAYDTEKGEYVPRKQGKGKKRKRIDTYSSNVKKIKGETGLDHSSNSLAHTKGADKRISEKDRISLNGLGHAFYEPLQNEKVKDVHLTPRHNNSRSQTPQEDIDASEPHVDKRHFMESLNLMPAGPRETSEDKSLGRRIPELDPICSYQAWQLDTRGRLVEATEKCLGWEERLADAELAYDTEKGEYVPRKQGKGKKRKRIDTYSSNVKKIKGETGLDHSSNSLAHTKGADKRISEKDRISLNGLGHAFYEPLQNEKVKDVHLTPRHNNSRSQTPQEDIDASEPHVDKRHFMESLNLMPAGPRETSEDKSLGRRIPELDPICSYQAWQLDTRGRLVEATEKCLGWEERLADAELAYDTEKGEYVPRKQGKGKKRKRIDTYSSNVKKIKGETGLDHSSNSLAHTKGADKRISEKDRISLNGLGHAFYEPLQNEKVKDVHLTPRHNNSRSQTPQEDIDASEPHVDKRHFMESLNLMPAGPRETSEDKSLGRRIPELDQICSYQAWQLDTRGRLVEATEKCLGWEERLADAELAYDTEKGEYVPRKQGKGKKRKQIDTYSSNVKKIKGETGLDHSSNSLAHTKGADKRISEKDRISLNGLGHAFYEPLQNEKVKDVHLTPRHNNSRSQTPQEDIDASEPHVDKRHFMESLNLMPAGPRETSEDKSLGRRIPELDPICSYQAWQLDTRGRLVEATEKCLGWEERLADAELAYDTEKGEYVPRKQGMGKKRKRIDTYSSNVKKIKGETGLDHSSNSLAHTKGADKRISEKDRISLNGLGHAFYEPLQNEKVKDVHLTPRHNNSRSQTPQEDIDASEPHVDKRHFMESLNLMPAGPRETSEDKSLGRRIPELDPICSYQAWQLDTRGRLVEATEKCLGWEERLADAELAYDTEKGEYVPRKQGKGKKRKRIDTYSSNVKKIKGETGLDHSSNSLAHTKGADKRISEKDRISLNGLGHAFYEPLQNEKVKDVHLTPRHNNSSRSQDREDNKAYLCEHCDFHTADASLLRSHVHKQHQDVLGPSSKHSAVLDNGNQSGSKASQYNDYLRNRSVLPSQPYWNPYTCPPGPGSAESNIKTEKSNGTEVKGQGHTITDAGSLLNLSSLPVSEGEGPVSDPIKTEGLVRHQCPYCSHTTKYPEALWIHQRVAHRVDGSSSMAPKWAPCMNSNKSPKAGGAQWRRTGPPPFLEGKDCPALPAPTTQCTQPPGLTTSSSSSSIRRSNRLAAKHQSGVPKYNCHKVNSRSTSPSGSLHKGT